MPRHHPETSTFLGLPPDGLQFAGIMAKHFALVSKETPITNILQASDLRRFAWDGNVLGEYDSDKSRAVAKGIRYRAFAEVEAMWFASATFGIPKRTAALAAYTLAEMMQGYVDQQDTTGLEALISGVSHKAFDALCRHYQLRKENAEVLFDDNATMVVYQYLGLLGLKDASVLTFFDTGRVMPDALKGQNPECLAHNFKPNIDIWENQKETSRSHVHLPANRLILIEHYRDEHYRGDDEIIDEILSHMEQDRPQLLVIPTVTRLGRRLPFMRYAKQIKAQGVVLGYDPIVILDDAQGLGRLSTHQYHASEGDLFNEVDGIFGTGAKVTGALMGSGFLLLNKDRLVDRQISFDSSPLLYRARRYSFISSDENRMHEYNRAARQWVHTPELGSFIKALEDIQIDQDVPRAVREVRERVVLALKAVPSVTVLELSRGKVSFVDSIIAFYLNGSVHEAAGLKLALANLAPPITLPSLVEADGRGYLRIALEPRAVLSPDYVEGVMDVITAIKREIDLMQSLL